MPERSTNEELLQVEQLSVAYGAGPVVHGVSLAVHASTVAALLGANGAGKSSTLRAIAGLEAAIGTVRFDGQDISRWNTAQRFRAGIVYVPEGRAIVSDLTVSENLTLGSYFVEARERERRRAQVLDFFPEIANRLKSPAGLLSGGEQQMLAIERGGLMSAPRLLLLDEPSLGLAPLLVARVYERLARIQQRRNCRRCSSSRTPTPRPSGNTRLGHARRHACCRTRPRIPAQPRRAPARDGCLPRRARRSAGREHMTTKMLALQGRWSPPVWPSPKARSRCPTAA